jgi:hypothetical protein
MTKYKYKDFATGKPHWTRKQFIGWTEKTGLLNVRYAIFNSRGGDLLVPEYCLSADSKKLISLTDSTT